MTEAAGLPKSRLRQRDYQAGACGVLDGVRVLDLSRLFAGNVLTQSLADFGADVIKVEPPAGDTLRGWKTEGVDTHWKIYARNKRSLCLDLRRKRSIELLLDLAPTAAILIESFRPGVLEKMGLSPDVLLARNPRLVIIRISGWGQDGPYHARPGFGTVIEGMSGFAAINGFADREPVLPPMYLADGVAGLQGSSAALVALREAAMSACPAPPRAWPSASSVPSAARNWSTIRALAPTPTGWRTSRNWMRSSANMPAATIRRN